MSSEAPRELEPERIDAVLAEVSRVWHRNPQKSLMRLMSRLTKNSPTFEPFDTPDSHLLAELKSIAPGQS